MAQIFKTLDQKLYQWKSYLTRGNLCPNLFIPLLLKVRFLVRESPWQMFFQSNGDDMKRLFFSMILFFLASNVHADDAMLYNNLPATYIGQFKWQNSNQIHQVVFTWDVQKTAGKGLISLEGKGRYGAGKKTIVKIKGIVDPRSHKIEIWESADDSANFATDQSHIGTISADLKMIETVWTTKGYSRFQGKLQLIRKETYQ